MKYGCPDRSDKINEIVEQWLLVPMKLSGEKGMAFDYKKEYKEFYMPKVMPSIVTVPKMNYIAVRGSGNPNDEDGEYK